MKTCSWHIHHGLCTQQQTEYTNITASTSRMKILLQGICLFQVTQVISVTSNILKKLCYNVDFEGGENWLNTEWRLFYHRGWAPSPVRNPGPAIAVSIFNLLFIGFLESLDDFYTLGSKIVVLQTTNNVFNNLTMPFSQILCSRGIE